MRIFLGLGTNLGDREANLIRAKDLLVKNGVMILGQSQVLETKPLYGVKQPDYLNQVVEARADASAEELLFICKKIEKEMGRPVDLPISNVKFGGVCARAQSAPPPERGKRVRNESRIIDIDILFYGEEKVEMANLLLPHHGVFERGFVIRGMCELAPEFFERMREKSTKIRKNLRKRAWNVHNLCS
ncbi:MAG: 2-amino-4-hydroxy-6-hydroxymethyldihydropteridine diphosphokinase [Candidatus Gracilibacteria bacterium]|jgi:7,8-dihydro-6-hydroxymethylpterin-pyrophosphokinase